MSVAGLAGPLEVRVPATSANVGVGFDCLGLALTLSNGFTFRPAERFSAVGLAGFLLLSASSLALALFL